MLRGALAVSLNCLKNRNGLTNLSSVRIDRNYARFTRRPTKIVNEDEVFGVKEEPDSEKAPLARKMARRMKPTMIPDDEIVAREIVLDDNDIRPRRSSQSQRPGYDNRASEHAEDEIFYPDDESHRHPTSRRRLSYRDLENMSYDNEFAPYEVEKKRFSSKRGETEASEDHVEFPPENLRSRKDRKRTSQLEFDGSEDFKQGSRMPRSIATDEDFQDDLGDPRPERKVIDKSIKKPAMKPKKEVSKKQMIEKKKDPNVTLNEDGSFNYINLDETDHQFSAMMINLNGRKARAKLGKVLLEGTRLIEDAMKAGHMPEKIFFSRIDSLKNLPLPKTGVTLYKVPYVSLQVWSSLATAPGIAAVFPIPNLGNNVTHDPVPLTIICDNIREPGNLGSILRVAAGVNCEKVVLLKGCVDLWDSKVLRSSTGAHFRVPVIQCGSWEDAETVVKDHADFYLADNNEMEVTPSGDLVNEEVLSELIRPVLEKEKIIQEKEKVKTRDVINGIKTASYYDVDYSKNDVVLIISGETSGISLQSALKLQKSGGMRVNVPLGNGVESLNSATALGIIAFEVKRQMALKNKNQETQEQSQEAVN